MKRTDQTACITFLDTHACPSSFSVVLSLHLVDQRLPELHAFGICELTNLCLAGDASGVVVVVENVFCCPSVVLS